MGAPPVPHSGAKKPQMPRVARRLVVTPPPVAVSPPYGRRRSPRLPGSPHHPMVPILCRPLRLSAFSPPAFSSSRRVVLPSFPSMAAGVSASMMVGA